MKKITRKKQLQFLAAHATEAVVHDIGAGTKPPYKHLFPNRIRIDIDPEKKPEILADICALPFADNSCDTILCLEVFEHLRDPQAAANELLRVLKPGGKMLLTTPFLFPLHNVPEDYARLTPYTLQTIFANWQIEQTVFQSEAFTTMGILMQRIGFQTDLRGGKITKLFIYGLAWLFTKFDWLIVTQYGEIDKTNPTPGVFSTGTYLVLRKSS